MEIKPLSYVEKFIKSLPKRDIPFIVRGIEKIEKYGPMALKKLRGYDLHEITIGPYRIICTLWGHPPSCWLLHAFRKKSYDTKLKDLEIANQRAETLKKSFLN